MSVLLYRHLKVFLKKELSPLKRDLLLLRRILPNKPQNYDFFSIFHYPFVSEHIMNMRAVMVYFILCINIHGRLYMWLSRSRDPFSYYLCCAHWFNSILSFCHIYHRVCVSLHLKIPIELSIWVGSVNKVRAVHSIPTKFDIHYQQSHVDG